MLALHRRLKPMSVITILGTLLGILACQKSPFSNRKSLNFLPDTQMNEMGVTAFAQIRNTETIETNKKMRAEIINIGKRIAVASGVKFKWEFEVLQSASTVNAFCLPGGKIIVYTGILPVAENTAALAAVIGHEVAHATLKHGAERASQELAKTFGMALADYSMKDKKYKNIAMASLGIGSKFGIMLPFSRAHESEADYVGLLYMAKAGYDPRQAPAFWKRMSKFSGTAHEFFSTHPNSVKRAIELETKMEEAMKFYRVAPRKHQTKKLTLK